MTAIIQIIITGLYMGAVYAIISVGLSSQYGVAKVLNVAHGEFIMVGAFMALKLNKSFGLSPLISLFIVGIVLFIICFLLHRTLFKRLRTIAPNEGAFEGNAILVAFGLMYIVQFIALSIWGAQNNNMMYMNTGVEIAGASFPANRFFVLAVAVVICAIYVIWLKYTRLGKSIRAAAQDSTAAKMLGIKTDRAMAICFGIGGALAGLSGVLIATYSSLTTGMGLNYTVVAIIIVVLGGLGSVPGAILGGFVLGFVGAIVSYFEQSLVLVVFYLIVLVLLIVRPKGLLGR
jgi:branched-chain amino acid transport system permease protein